MGNSAGVAQSANRVPALALLPALEGLLRRGVGVERIEAAFRCRIGHLYEPTLRLPLLFSRRFWALAVEASGDPDIALELAVEQSNDVIQALGSLLLDAPSLEHGVRRLNTYLPSCFGPFEIEIARTARDVQLRVHDRGVLAAPQAIDYLLASLSDVFQRALIAPGIRGVTLLQATPQRVARYARLGLVVQGQAHVSALHIDPACFVPVAGPGGQLCAAYVEECSPAKPDTLLLLVCDYIAAELAQGPSIEGFCGRYGMLRRTVARQLRAEGWSFRELLEQYRQLSALDLVTGAPLVQARVAELLGYRDLSSFARAFARWYGISPGAFRSGYASLA
ncbi:AraC family transcriptional regulator [Pseudomonas sp. LS44]|uniref:helix-turn-helix transcriptional regulator n=1 Tax=Pseudomonas sp. LS44 TaxID=1357074 RepID=UPI00215AC4A9|nr:AraC family transcriptional regulator [Pseudomonas sp. LS44]UVE17122.1 AraC family transcriptional regulator [Pseudomonas sp. LS44]